MFGAFLRLGVNSFGGPIAHVGYFRNEFVQRRGWLDAGTFLSGYGAAQAGPGPMFSLAAFLGAQVPTGLHPALGAALALRHWGG